MGGIVNATEILDAFATDDSVAPSTEQSDAVDGTSNSSVSGIAEGIAALRAFRDWVHSSHVDDLGLQLDKKRRDSCSESQHSTSSRSSPEGLGKRERFKYSHRSARTSWKVPDTFPDNRIVQAYVKPNVEESKEAFSFQLPDLDGIRHFCRTRLKWAQTQ